MANKQETSKERRAGLAQKHEALSAESREKFPELSELAAALKTATDKYGALIDRLHNAQQKAGQAKQEHTSKRKEFLVNKVPGVTSFFKAADTLGRLFIGGSLYASKMPYEAPTLNDLKSARQYFLETEEFAALDPKELLQKAELEIIEAETEYKKYIIGMDAVKRVEAFELQGKMSALESELKKA